MTQAVSRSGSVGVRYAFGGAFSAPMNISFCAALLSLRSKWEVVVFGDFYEAGVFPLVHVHSGLIAR